MKTKVENKGNHSKNALNREVIRLKRPEMLRNLHISTSMSHLCSRVLASANWVMGYFQR